MPCYEKGLQIWKCYKTRKDKRKFDEDKPYYENRSRQRVFKRTYNRQLRRYKGEIKGSQWKKFQFADLWNIY